MINNWKPKIGNGKITIISMKFKNKTAYYKSSKKINKLL